MDLIFPSLRYECISMKGKGFHILLDHQEPTTEAHTPYYQDRYDYVVQQNDFSIRKQAIIYILKCLLKEVQIIAVWLDTVVIRRAKFANLLPLITHFAITEELNSRDSAPVQSFNKIYNNSHAAARLKWNFLMCLWLALLIFTFL